jgi:hypothetical protein
MPEFEPTLYDELGVAPDASEEALRAGYRRRARQLHPDVAAEAGTGEAMLRLNQAWRVLSDAQQRRRYDEALGHRSVAPAATVSDAGPEVEEPVELRHRVPFLRPSALVLVTLAILFVVTAYAGSWPGQNGGSPAPVPSTAPGPPRVVPVVPVGQCLAATPTAGLNVLVPCSTPNDGQILAEVAAPDQCPSGTVGHLWTLRPTVLCTTSTSP